jgi:hypothetical protein
VELFAVAEVARKAFGNEEYRFWKEWGVEIYILLLSRGGMGE